MEVVGGKVKVRSVTAVLLSVGLALVAVVLVQPPALAAFACGPSPGSLFSGAYSGRSSGIYGVRAKIEYNNPNLCGNDGTGYGVSSAWSMVTAHSLHGGPDGYAQVGYVQFGQGSNPSHHGIHVFAQWTTKCSADATCGPGDARFRTKFQAAPTVAKMYTVVRRSSDGHIHMLAAGSQVAEMGYNTHNDWSPSWQGQFMGETKHYGDDMPGKKSDKTSYWYLQKYNSAGNINFFSSLSPVRRSDTYCRYHRHIYNANVGGKGLHVWTSPLTNSC